MLSELVNEARGALLKSEGSNEFYMVDLKNQSARYPVNPEAVLTHAVAKIDWSLNLFDIRVFFRDNSAPAGQFYGDESVLRLVKGALSKLGVHSDNLEYTEAMGQGDDFIELTDYSTGEELAESVKIRGKKTNARSYFA